MFFSNLRHTFGALTLISVLSACGGETTEVITPTVTENTKIMFYNGGSAGSFFSLNDKKLTDSLGAAKASAYLSVTYTPNSSNVLEFKSSSNVDLSTQTAVLKKDASFSFFSWKKPQDLGTPQAYGSILVEDALTAPAAGKSKLRAAIMNRDGGSAYDIVMIDSVQTQNKIFTNVSLGSVSEFKDVTPGTYRFVFYSASGAFNHGSVQNIKLEAGKIYTLASTNKVIGSSDVSADLLPNN